jgi:site-specific DNA recombinase
VYDDRAISGASRFRPGFQRLLADAEAGRFDTVVCEAIDRLGRKLSDVADFHDRLTFFKVQIHAESLGPGQSHFEMSEQREQGLEVVFVP